MKSKAIQITLAVLIGVLCLYLFATSIEDWSKVWNAMLSVHLGYFVLAVLIQYLSMLIRAIRWQSFLHKPVVSIPKLFLINCIGFMGNGVFPARMGEVIRGVLIWRYTPHTFTTGVATLIVERVFDLLGLLLILGFVLWVFPFPTTAPADVNLSGVDVPLNAEQLEMPNDPLTWIQNLGIIGVFLFIVLISVIGTMSYAPDWSLKVARKLLKPFPEKISEPLIKAVISFEKGASTLRRPSSFIYCLILTLTLWVVIAFSELVILWALDINSIGMPGALFIMVGLCFAVMFPQLPGYVGPYHFAFLIMLHQTFHIDESLAGAAAWVMWFSQVPPVIALGFVCLLIMGVSFREISHIQEHVPETAVSLDDSNP